MIPVRCFTCGKLIASKFRIYQEMKEQGLEESEIFKKLGFTKYCCKRMFISAYDYSIFVK